MSYYPSMDYGIDTNRTFEMKDLLIFTDNLEVIDRQIIQRLKYLPKGTKRPRLLFKNDGVQFSQNKIFKIDCVIASGLEIE